MARRMIWSFFMGTSMAAASSGEVGCRPSFSSSLRVVSFHLAISSTMYAGM